MSLTERIIPITILDGGPAKVEEANNGKEKVSSKRQSLTVTLDDGTTTEIDGLVTKLGEANKVEKAQDGLGVELKIEEIGQETLKREIRERSSTEPKEATSCNSGGRRDASAENKKRIKFLFGKEAKIGDNAKSKHGDKVSSSSSSKQEKPKAGGKRREQVAEKSLEREVEEFSEAVSAPTLVTDLRGKAKEPPEAAKETDEEKVRFVPIRMPDGRVLQRDPDETVEIKTEFTNYCHQEFSDSKPHTPSPKKEASPDDVTARERIVPITLENGDQFMPKFTTLDDVEPPEWSAFNPKNRQKVNGGIPVKEKIVPIKMEDTDKEETSTVFRKTSQTSSSSREESPIRTTKRTTTRQSREKMTKSHEKRVQHSVRFLDQENGDLKASQPRSSSADGRKRQPSSAAISPLKSNLRERHRSGGPAAGVPTDEKSRQEKTLHEIDRDINKIWKELQELDAFPTVTSRPPISGLPRRGSPARGVTLQTTAPVPTATPVKIRTFTTPTPSNIQAASTASSTESSRTSSPHSRRPGFERQSSSSSPVHVRVVNEPAASSRVTNYNPRRDLEPTRPGAITPVYITATVPASSGSSPAPYKVISSSPSYTPSSTPTNTVTKTMVTSSDANRVPPVTAAAAAHRASTVLKQHENKSKAEKVQSNEFYPKFETRPRNNSFQKQECAKKPQDQLGIHVEEVDNNNHLDQDKEPATIDRACQTDKKGAKRCTLQ